MSSQNPSTPVKVSSSAASYTPATRDQELRSNINTLLIKDGHIQKIQEHLLHTLHSHSSNWPTAIQSHALTLLRSGEVTTFPALMRRVLDDVRHDNTLLSSKGEVNGTTATTNGTTAKNGTAKANGVDAGSAGLAIPPAVIEEVLKVARESLETVCEVGDEGAT